MRNTKRKEESKEEGRRRKFVMRNTERKERNK
jgi:hypothetical protein